MRGAAAILEDAPVILADGAIETRLIYEFGLPTHDFSSFVHLFTPEGRAALDAIYRGYMRVAGDSRLPMQVGTPTWRAHPEGLARQGFAAPDDLRRVNEEAFRFLAGMREELGLRDLVMIAGVIGPRRDGYDPAVAPDAAEAEAYHRPQAQLLADLGVDLLYAPTFASAQELLGVARAMAATGLPYALAPVIDDDARLIDGTPLDAAVAAIDEAASPPPGNYLIACTHAVHVTRAQSSVHWPANGRVTGLKANASPLPPSALDRLDHLEQDDPETFADGLAKLHAGGMRFLGGCCGTGEAHIAALARRFVAEPA